MSTHPKYRGKFRQADSVSVRLLVCLLPVYFSCDDAVVGTSVPQDQSVTDSTQVIDSLTPRPSRTVPVAPSNTASVPWGGMNPSSRQLPAVIANRAGSALNWAWHEQGESVFDAIVSIPVQLSESSISSLNDGITHAGVSLGAWEGTQPPMIAIMVRNATGDLRLRVEFHPDLDVLGDDLEVRWDNSPSMKYPLTEGTNGYVIAEWNEPLVRDDAILQVRTIGSVGTDWYVVHFSHQTSALDTYLSTIPEGFLENDSGWSLPDPASIAASDSGAYAELGILGPGAPYALFESASDTLYSPHATLGATAVGKSRIWGASIPTVPLEHRYECLPARDTSEESSAGLPSGMGWHTVRNQAKSIVNSLELRPILTALGQTQLLPPPALNGGQHAHSLTDSAVFRWLHPGELAVAREPQQTEMGGVAAQRIQHVWVLADDSESRCFETWFHPCVPITISDFTCPGVEVVFYGTDAPIGDGDELGVGGTLQGLGSVTPGDENWDGSSGLNMVFDSGLDKWTATMLLPPGTSGTFAMYVKRSDGTVLWENGRRVLETTGIDGQLHQMQWFAYQ